MENLITAVSAAGIAAIAIAFVILGTLAYKQLKDYVKLKGYQTAYDQFLGYAETIVRSLEQQGLLMGFSGLEKKRLAVVALRKMTSYFGLNISDDMLDKIIEGAVHIINSEAGKFFEETELGQDMQEIRGERIMDISSHWPYLEWVAGQRLAHNQTSRQYSQGTEESEIARYKHDIELLGAAGELAARRFLKLPDQLHTGFDNGVDIFWNGYRIDVKATQLTSKVQYRYLQWWVEKWMKADIVLMTAVDLKAKQAEFMGYAWASEVTSAPINKERDRPCHEIAIPELKNIWNLWSLDENREETYTPRDYRPGAAQRLH